MSIIEFVLDGGGQTKQKQEIKDKYFGRPLLALCNRKQNTAVIKTSAVAVWSVNKGRGTDSAEILLPASTFTVIESG